MRLVAGFWKRLTCRHIWIRVTSRYFTGEGTLLGERCWECGAKRWRMTP